jgi:hypothetical protein
MPIRLEIPLVKESTLDKVDKYYGLKDGDSPTRVSIRQATQGQHEKRAALFSNIIREWSQQADGVRLIQRFSFEELKRIEVQLTLASCNIEDAEGEPLFKFDKKGFIVDEGAFKRAWDSLPPLVADAIHEKVLEVNEDWEPDAGN